MFHYIGSIIYLYFRPLIKWILRQTTRMCELQRICYGEPSGASRTLAVEKSFILSRNDDIVSLVAYLNGLSDKRGISIKTERGILEEALKTVLLAKSINPIAHPDFARMCGKCIEQIWGYRQLCVECEELRRTQYDSDNEVHEKLLLGLWNLLMPFDPLNGRITKKWQDIGFQGDDPKTDFRGMGMLGLENLVFFSKEYPSAATHVLSHSLHPNYGYAFAIVGINITSMALRLLKDGSAKTHVYNCSKTLLTISAFHRFYCYLFYEFNKFWIQSKPKSMMEFSSIQEKFERNIRTALKNPRTIFKMNISVDIV